MPPSGSGVSAQILATLQRMEKSLSGARGPSSSGGGSSHIAGAVAVGNIASSFLGRAAGSSGVAGDTLGSEGSLLMQAIGSSDPSVVNKIMAAANAVNFLRQSWDKAGASAKEYGVRSAIGLGVTGAAARYVPALGHLMFGGTGTVRGVLQGGANLAIGHTTEAVFGRNLASSAFEVAGAFQLASAVSGRGAYPIRSTNNGDESSCCSWDGRCRDRTRSQ